MVKEGPCRHCGVTSTPLWRNGPPEKPILCNACGSRWRTKGNLTNYTPLHARLDAEDYEDYKVLCNRRKEVKALKRKKNRGSDVVGLGEDVCDNRYSYQKNLDDDSSYRSSSGSDESNSESFGGPFTSTIGSDMTGSEQSFVWDTTMPPRKRTCNKQLKPSPIEKLTKDLYTILQEQLSYCPEAHEEQLLYESDTPMVYVEMGYGSVLIRHPSEHQEESEASSISPDIKCYPESQDHRHLVCHVAHTESKGATFPPPRTENSKKISGQATMNQTQSYKSESANIYDIQHLLGRRDSPLCTIDLNGIINLEEFTAQLTPSEHRQLLKYLPKSDIENYPNSLKDLFNDPLIQESSLSFQKLLSEGVFDLSFPNAKRDDCQNLRRLALCNRYKSHWVQQYTLLKRSHNPAVERNVQGSKVSKVVQLAQKSQTTDNKIYLKNTSITKIKHNIHQTKKFVDTHTGFLPIGLPISVSHPLPNDGVHNDQDLLLDVKSNYAFPQAELLPQSLVCNLALP